MEGSGPRRNPYKKKAIRACAQLQYQTSHVEWIILERGSLERHERNYWNVDHWNDTNGITGTWITGTTSLVRHALNYWNVGHWNDIIGATCMELLERGSLERRSWNDVTGTLHDLQGHRKKEQFLARVEWLPVTSRTHRRTDKCKISIMIYIYFSRTSRLNIRISKLF